jgi:hypothetical protein
MSSLVRATHTHEGRVVVLGGALAKLVPGLMNN